MGCSQIPRTCLGSRKGQEREEKGQWSLQASWPVQQEGTSSGGGGGGGGVLRSLTNNKIAVLTGRKMRVWGVLPLRAQNQS